MNLTNKETQAWWKDKKFWFPSDDPRNEPDMPNIPAMIAESSRRTRLETLEEVREIVLRDRYAEIIDQLDQSIKEAKKV